MERGFFGARPSGTSSDASQASRWTRPLPSATGSRFADRSHGAVPLHCYLRGLARLFLEAHGPVARPRSPDDAGPRGSKIPGLAAPDPEPHEGPARWAWRWLSLALPPDLLLAGLAGDRGAPADIDLLSPTLRTQLDDGGYAEIHMHLGAGMDFPLLWLGALHAVASPETKAGAFASPGAALGEGRELGPWLLRVAIGRLVLAAYLKRGPGDPGSLAAFVTDVLAPSVAGASGAVVAASLHACIDDLLAGRLGGAGPGLRRSPRPLLGLDGRTAGLQGDSCGSPKGTRSRSDRRLVPAGPSGHTGNEPRGESIPLLR